MARKRLTFVIVAIIAIALAVLVPACSVREGNKDPEQVTVTYDANGGTFGVSDTRTEKVNKGELIVKPPEPTRDKYTFEGWSKSRTQTSLWNFATDKAEADLTLYAVWKGEVIIKPNPEIVGTLTFDKSVSYCIIFDQPDKTGGVIDYATGIYIMRGALNDIIMDDKESSGGVLKQSPMEAVYTIPKEKAPNNAISDFEYLVRITMPAGASRYVQFATSGLSGIITDSKLEENGSVCTFVLKEGTGDGCGVKAVRSEKGDDYVYALSYNLWHLFRYTNAIDGITNVAAYEDFRSVVAGTYKFEFTINSKTQN